MTPFLEKQDKKSQTSEKTFPFFSKLWKSSGDFSTKSKFYKLGKCGLMLNEMNSNKRL